MAETQSKVIPKSERSIFVPKRLAIVGTCSWVVTAVTFIIRQTVKPTSGTWPDTLLIVASFLTFAFGLLSQNLSLVQALLHNVEHAVEDRLNGLGRYYALSQTRSRDFFGPEIESAEVEIDLIISQYNVEAHTLQYEMKHRMTFSKPVARATPIEVLVAPLPYQGNKEDYCFLPQRHEKPADDCLTMDFSPAYPIDADAHKFAIEPLMRFANRVIDTVTMRDVKSGERFVERTMAASTCAVEYSVEKKWSLPSRRGELAEGARRAEVVIKVAEHPLSGPWLVLAPATRYQKMTITVNWQDASCKDLTVQLIPYVPARLLEPEASKMVDTKNPCSIQINVQAKDDVWLTPSDAFYVVITPRRATNEIESSSVVVR